MAEDENSIKILRLYGGISIFPSDFSVRRVAEEIGARDHVVRIRPRLNGDRSGVKPEDPISRHLEQGERLEEGHRVSAWNGEEPIKYLARQNKSK